MFKNKNMNFSLAKEIYGTPWCIDAISMLQLNAVLKSIQNGVVIDSETKNNSFSLFKNESKLVYSSYDLNSKENFNGIAILNLNGVITKNGGQSSYGTKQISKEMLNMYKDDRIKGFIINTDSGGGSSNAVSLLVDTINQIKQTKPVIGFVEKGGMACSAAYGILSACTSIYSESEMNIVGSVGTMIQFSGKPNGNVDRNGEKTIVIYATKSTQKDKAFEEAINNDNYELLINDLLNPVNENFINMVLENRPLLKGSSYDDGHTVFSKDAIGTFIDGIASFEEVTNMFFKNNYKQNTMNKNELKQEHANLYSEIVQEGVLKERERIASWNAFREIDTEAVENGISSGTEVSALETKNFMQKAIAMSKVNDLRSDNALDVVVNESAVMLNDSEKELENLKKGIKIY